VDSIPPGAQVRIDGQELGLTPLDVEIDLRGESPRTVELTFHMEAYNDAAREVELVDGETAEPRPVRLISPHPLPVAAIPLPDQGVGVMEAGYAVATPDGGIMVWVPEGPFTAGYPTDYPEPEAQAMNPERRVELDGFWIDVHEVTNEQYAVFVEETGYDPPSHWRGNRPPEEIADHPVTHVALSDADAYARWARKRLPTEEQWEKAARGDRDDRLFPWGDRFERGDANVGTQVGEARPVMSYEKDVSPYGVYDMAGNVREWVLGRWSGHPERLIMRGGSFGATDASNNPEFAMIPFRGYVEPGLIPRYQHLLGFRCVVSE
jgi:formylglycine-generating enzyme required for sulfatase activity